MTLVPRSLTRGTPETHILDNEGRAVRVASRSNPPSPVRSDLEASFRAFTEMYGPRAAFCWAAAKAHHNPSAETGSNRDRAEALFSKERSAAA